MIKPPTEYMYKSPKAFEYSVGVVSLPTYLGTIKTHFAAALSFAHEGNSWSQKTQLVNFATEKKACNKNNTVRTNLI